MTAILDGCDSQGGRSPLPTLDYLHCVTTALIYSDVLDRGGGSTRDDEIQRRKADGSPLDHSALIYKQLRIYMIF